MPVYLMTAHAYRSWHEDFGKGYVQRGEGLKPSSKKLAQWRANHATHQPAIFPTKLQEIFQNVVYEIAHERGARLHVTAITSTHVHILISFRSPACTCGASEYCRSNCQSRKFAEVVIARMKRKMGQSAAKLMRTTGRPWFSRGWDLTPVRGKANFDFLTRTYLPKHATEERGIVRNYD